MRVEDGRRDEGSHTFKFAPVERAWVQVGAGMSLVQAEDSSCHGDLIVHVDSGLAVTVVEVDILGSFHWSWLDPEWVLQPCDEVAFAQDYFIGAAALDL